MKSKLLAGGALALLFCFPLYHHLAVPSDVLSWSPPSVWGPGAEQIGHRQFRFSPPAGAGDVTKDQGVTYLLRHASTRRLTFTSPAGAEAPPTPEPPRLHLTATCTPAPCTLEVRTLGTQGQLSPEDKWPWATFVSERQEVSVGVPSGALRSGALRSGVVEVQLVRSRAIREQDSATGVTVVELYGAEFR